MQAHGGRLEVEKAAYEVVYEANNRPDWLEIPVRGVVSATLGTSGVVFAHADKPQYDPQGRVHTMCHAVEGKWCVFGCMLSAGGSLQWFRNHLGRAEVEQAKKRKIDPYDLLIEESQDAPPGCEGLLFLPYLTGERCPYPDPKAFPILEADNNQDRYNRRFARP